MSATPLIELSIDGQPVAVPPGSTIMQAAKKIGIAIPHFCYHEKLSIAANCRMCLVQAEKMPKPVPACATPVMAGMKVFTRSEMAVSAQKGVMELLLINHPLDCPICDQGGECSLQDMAMGYGGVHSPYNEEKRVVVNKNLGPLISTDMTRCIHCTRCVRFGEEWGGFMELGMGNRGEHSEIMTFMQSTVDSEISGNAIDLCPVGALTSKPFRFSARSWELTDINSVSPHDSWGSQLLVQKKDDGVYRVLPKKCDEINQEWLADRDRFSYTALNSESRLTSPMVREGGQWREINWQLAFEKLRDWHQPFGNQDWQIYAHPSSSLETLSMIARLAETIGISATANLRSNDPHLPQPRTLGQKIKHFEQTDRVLLIGSFLRSEQPLFAARLRQSIRQGAQVCRLHAVHEPWQMPIHAETLVHPDLLAPSLAQLMAIVAQKIGVDLPPNLRHIIPKGQPEASLDAIADSLLSGKHAWIGLGHYAENHPQASTFSAIVQAISTMINQRHPCHWGYLVSGANSLGVQMVGLDRHAATLLQQQPKIVWLFGVDGAVDFAERTLAQKTLDQASALIRFSAFLPQDSLDTALTDRQLILPMAIFAEAEGTLINAEGRIQNAPAAVPPQGGARPGWKILRQIAPSLAPLGGVFAPLESLFEEDNELSTIRAKALSRPQFGKITACGNWLVDLPAPSFQDINTPPPTSASELLVRVAELNIYGTDPLVRRAAPLQQTASAKLSVHPTGWVHPATLAKHHIDTQVNRLGQLVGHGKLTDPYGQSCILHLIADCHLAEGTIRLMSGHALPFSDHQSLALSACAQAVVH